MKAPVLFLLIMLAAVSSAGSVSLMDDTVSISVGQYIYVSFRVQHAQTANSRIESCLMIKPDSLSLELMLFHVDDFMRWSNHEEEIDTLFHQHTGSGSRTIPIQGCGDYYLVLSNRGNMNPCTAAVDLVLLFEGDGREYDSLSTALKLAVFLMAIAAVAAFAIRLAVSLKRSKPRSR